MTNPAARGLAAIAEAALSTTSPAAIAAAAADRPAAGATERPAAAAAAQQPDNTAAIAQARADGKAEGVKEGGSAERTRIKAIVTSEKAKGREAMAASLAFNTDLSSEQAIAVLGDAPEAAKASRLDGIVPTPKVDAVEGEPGDRKPLLAGLAAATQAEFERRNPGAARK